MKAEVGRAGGDDGSSPSGMVTARALMDGAGGHTMAPSVSTVPGAVIPHSTISGMGQWQQLVADWPPSTMPSGRSIEQFQASPGNVRHDILISKQQVGRVIGAGGSMFKELTQKTGCNIFVLDKVGAKPRRRARRTRRDLALTSRPSPRASSYEPSFHCPDPRVQQQPTRRATCLLRCNRRVHRQASAKSSG